MTDATLRSKKINRVLKKLGFIDLQKIANTLQGSIWRAISENDNNSRSSSVIKVTNRSLHRNSVTVIKNQRYQIEENILIEQSILKFLTQRKNCPSSIIKFHRFFQSNTNYYLKMEDGGICLVDFINNVIKMNYSGKVVIVNWREVVHTIFKQMVECIQFLHALNVCHFDISLENFLINDVELEIHRFHDGTKKDQARFVTSDIQIKLCDFGLAQLFTTSSCRSSKFCGKRNYKSPEVVNQKRNFDAKKNDIWALGIVLFSLLTGGSLWNTACDTNALFVHTINGGLFDALKRMNLLDAVDEDVIDLLQSIFRYENERVNISQIERHSWLQPTH